MRTTRRSAHLRVHQPHAHRFVAIDGLWIDAADNFLFLAHAGGSGICFQDTRSRVRPLPCAEQSIVLWPPEVMHEIVNERNWAVR